MTGVPTISIDDSVAAAGVRLTLGVIACRVSFDGDSNRLSERLSAAAAQRARQLADAPVAEIPAIAATRRVYKALGKDPSRYRPSAEALLRRVAQGKDLHHINAVVDTNNLVSLQTGISIGAYDRATVQPPIALVRGSEGMSYEAIGRGPINLAGLPVLVDQSGPFGSPTSDSVRSKVTRETERLFMVLFSFGNVSDPASALDLAVECLESHCGATDLETRLIAT